MEFVQAKNQIKQKFMEYVSEHLTPSKSKNQYICPFCASGTGPKATGAFTVYPEKNRYKCFSCGLSGDIFDLAAQIEGISDKKAVFRFLADKYSLQVDYQKPANSCSESEKKKSTAHDYSQFYKSANAHLNETAYHRGIGTSTLNRFCIGFVPDWQPPNNPNAPKTPRLIIPRSSSSYLARDTRQDIPDWQQPYSKQNSPDKISLFNISALKNTKKPLYIVEGEFDAMSICDVGGEAVAVCSTSNIHSFLQAVKEILSQKSAVQPFIIAFDNDTAGQKASEILSNGLHELEMPFCVYNPYGSHKDANEALNADRMKFQADILYGMEHISELTADRQNKEKSAYIQKNSVSAYLNEFLDGVSESVYTSAVPTGFRALDHVLDGGLYEGLYGIGAISSLGKTTFVLQIADQIAENGNDAIIFSLEMSRNELIAKSLSRKTAMITLHSNRDMSIAKTTRGILTGKRYSGYSTEEKQLINTALQQYRQYSDRIFIIEGMGEVGVETIRAEVEKHIKNTGKKPVVIIDYLQILAPHNEKSTDKQNTDHAILHLKRLSRDYKLPVIVISSFNRENYSSKVSMQAFKESGAIEYSSDVLIGLQLMGTGTKNFDVDEAKSRYPREIEAVILKNRNGTTGKKIGYKYYTPFNCFSEIGIL